MKMRATGVLMPASSHGDHVSFRHIEKVREGNIHLTGFVDVCMVSCINFRRASIRDLREIA